MHETGPVEPGATPLPALRELGRLLRRSFDAVRTWGPRHTVTVESRKKVVAHFFDVLQRHGEFDLELSGLAISWREQVIDEGKTRTDSLSMPLFREGVRRVTFTPELTTDDLEPFLDGWTDAWVNPATAEGVSARLWERQPKGLRAVVVDTFELGGGDDVPADAGSQRLSAREQVDAIISAIASESLAGSAEVAQAAIVSISKEDVALLRSDAVRTITAQQLAAHDTDELMQSGLSADDQRALTTELEAARAAPLTSFVRVLVNAALLAGDAEQAVAAGLFERLALDLIAKAQAEQAFALYRAAVADVQRDPALNAQRVSLLKRLRDVLMGEKVVDALVNGLGEEHLASQNEAALRSMGKPAATFIMARLTRLTGPTRERASKLATSLDATAAATAARAQPTSGGSTDSALLSEALKTAATLPEAERVALLQRALNVTDVAVRRAAARLLTPRLVVQLPVTLLTNRLGDQDAEIRQAFLSAAVEQELPVVVPAAVALLKRSILPEERQRLYDALVTVGGPKALQALIAEVETQADQTMKIAAVHALGRTRDPRAVQVLTELANKLLTPPKLKAACREALGGKP